MYSFSHFLLNLFIYLKMLFSLWPCLEKPYHILRLWRSLWLLIKAFIVFFLFSFFSLHISSLFLSFFGVLLFFLWSFFLFYKCSTMFYLSPLFLEHFFHISLILFPLFISFYPYQFYFCSNCSNFFYISYFIFLF
jgi:hypothetical protein